MSSRPIRRSGPTSKNQGLDLEVPYRYGSQRRTYLPDFVVLINDGRGNDDLLHLIVEIKGYRREDAKDKKTTMDTYWVPGVNHHGGCGRWAFAEFTDPFRMEAAFNRLIEQFRGGASPANSRPGEGTVPNPKTAGDRRSRQGTSIRDSSGAILL